MRKWCKKMRCKILENRAVRNITLGKIIHFLVKALNFAIESKQKHDYLLAGDRIILTSCDTW